AIELKSDMVIAYNNRGLVKQSLQDLPGALADFTRAIELKPDFDIACNNRGLVKRHLGDLAGAIADFTKAIALKPDAATYYNNRAGVRRKKNDLEGALADYDHAIKLKPDYAEAWYNRSVSKSEADDAAGSAADLAQAVKLNPSFAKAATKPRKAKPAKPKPTGVIISNLDPNQKMLPITEHPLVLRTDFSGEAAWHSLSAALQNPDDEFSSPLSFIDDPAYTGITAAQLPAMLGKDSAHPFAVIIDHLALTHEEHPVLVVDLQETPGSTFRVISSALGLVASNLSIANMGFEEFAGAVDKDGVFRGFE
ncbi:MAG TPA: tetratricopeptide repeat protein, partial [Verrucomicrobiae bacterium]|nr:tetratricopeptide repeat protein [Verrucomicrobiae bacterium]